MSRYRKIACFIAGILVVPALATYILTREADKAANRQLSNSEPLPISVGVDGDIAAVKSHRIAYGGTMDLPYVERSIVDAVSELAGIDGKIDWASVASTKYKHNPAVACVEARIEIPANGKRREKKVVVRFFRNRETGVVDLDSLKINGKPAAIPAVILMYGL